MRDELMGVLVGALVVSGFGCGAETGTVGSGPGGGGGPTTTDAPPGTEVPPKPGHLPADQVVWQVRSGGGLVPYAVNAAEVATITVYGDGRLFVAAPTADHRPGHPVPIERGQVAPDDLVAFVRSVDASGLFTRPDTDFGSPLVTDVPTTRVTFQGDRDRSPVEASVYAFDDEFTDDLTDAQVDRRHALEDLIDEAESLASDTKSWTPDRVRVTDISERDMDTSQVPAPWPGPAFADFLEIPAPDGAGRPCGELSGDAAAAVFAAASENEGIRFEHAGEQRDLVVAPLLPGEKACADL